MPMLRMEDEGCIVLSSIYTILLIVGSSTVVLDTDMLLSLSIAGPTSNLGIVSGRTRPRGTRRDSSDAKFGSERLARTHVIGMGSCGTLNGSISVYSSNWTLTHSIQY